MSSAFFRRPGDSSSSSEERDDSEAGDLPSEQTDNSIEGLVQTNTTESLPSHDSLSQVDEIGTAPTRAQMTAEQHKTNMLTALLEDFARSRAAEMLNDGTSTLVYDRSSPEVQPLAGSLYDHIVQSLRPLGVLPAARSDSSDARVRATYLTGLQNLVSERLGTELVQDRALQRLSGSAPATEDLAVDRTNSELQIVQNRLSAMSMAHVQIQPSLSPSHMLLTPPQSRLSHYESSFKQLRLLGKGGFGSVYMAYNVYDKKEYAIKKIPLSPRLSQRYKESGSGELGNVLREVEVLAQLEHSNIVRYHATWIEEPIQTRNDLAYQSNTRILPTTVRLIADHPTRAKEDALLHPAKSRKPQHSDGILFDADSQPDAADDDDKPPGELIWSFKGTDSEISSARASEIFTDGKDRPNLSQNRIEDDSVYVLHVQMSLYPVSLAQYIVPPAVNGTDSVEGHSWRHCFHLVPALRLLLGILCGLQYIHARGLIHRDVKPSNIFMADLDLSTASLIPEGYHDVGSCSACTQPMAHFVNPRIGDFGLVAAIVQDSEAMVTEQTTRPVGTEFYRPPAWTGAESSTTSHLVMDEKLDVFALGVIFIELLWPCSTSTERMHVLRDAQKGRSPRGLAEKIESENHASGLGQAVLHCISGMIEPNPQHRYKCSKVKELVESMLGTCEAESAMVNFKHRHDQTDMPTVGLIRSLDEVAGRDQSN